VPLRQIFREQRERREEEAECKALHERSVARG
jgi:hypothetical protein